MNNFLSTAQAIFLAFKVGEVGLFPEFSWWFIMSPLITWLFMTLAISVWVSAEATKQKYQNNKQ